jgi:SAM-dependent methyltransferase
MSLQEYAHRFGDEYGIPAAFCERYLRDRLPAVPTDGDMDGFLAALSPTQRLYLEYAFATNRRGRDLLQRYPRTGTPRRILDIGCGYGGTVKAFAEAGDQALGLEIDPTLAEYAALNLEGTRGATVRCEDIVGSEPGALGQFDLVFCSDVIEHVSDPDRVLDAVPQLLAPGGRFIMHVPNRDSIQQVLSDEHFCLFGFTLLSRQEGRELKRQIQQWDDPYQHMGRLLPLAYYLNRLRAGGLAADVQTAAAPTLDGALARLGEAATKMEQARADARLSWFTRQEMTQAFARYAGAFLQTYAEAVDSGDPAAFSQRFVAPTWTVLASRPASSSDACTA